MITKTKGGRRQPSGVCKALPTQCSVPVSTRTPAPLPPVTRAANGKTFSGSICPTSQSPWSRCPHCSGLWRLPHLLLTFGSCLVLLGAFPGLPLSFSGWESLPPRLFPGLFPGLLPLRPHLPASIPTHHTSGPGPSLGQKPTGQGQKDTPTGFTRSRKMFTGHVPACGTEMR